FGFGEEEATLYEAAGVHVELADLGGVGAAPGKVDQARGILGRQAAGAPVGPIDPFISGQAVYVEHDLPFGIVGQVRLDGRPAEDTPFVLVVLPEVVEVVTLDGRIGDP